MRDLSTFSPVILATLTPYKGHVEDVKREFASLAQHVWDNEETTRLIIHVLGRCYYWLYPEGHPDTMHVFEIYDGEKGIDVHACGELTFDTFRRTYEYGIRVDLEGLRRRRDGLPPIPTNPDVEERGLVCEYMEPVAEVKSFMGSPQLDGKQVTRITSFQTVDTNVKELTQTLVDFASLAKETGKIETFWVLRDTNIPRNYKIVTRFLSKAQAEEFDKIEEVRKFNNALQALTESSKEVQCKWANQGFFLKE
ncbi:hypothetical protein J3E72DRAFT_432374 [Bipolaris maydis]|nr:hypothetical protein J3E72DRAFT_432374 [Bipolaris maydis]